MHNASEIDSLRGVEAFATFLDEVREQKSDHNATWDGRPFDDEARTTWADLLDAEKKAEAGLVELRARLSTIAEAAKDEKRSERYQPFTARNSSQSHVPENVFAYEEYRSRSSNDEQLGQALRDGALKAIEGMHFPHPNVRPDEARSNVQMLLDYKDTRDRELARRIILTGSPVYYRAFNKLACGLPLTAEEQRGTALAMGAVATGGYLVPAAFDPPLSPIGAWTAVDPVRSDCRVEQIVGSNVWRGLTATAVVATRATEATVMVEQDRKSTRLNSSHTRLSRMPSSA